jgi:hypothetical protein
VLFAALTRLALLSPLPLLSLLAGCTAVSSAVGLIDPPDLRHPYRSLSLRTGLLSIAATVVDNNEADVDIRRYRR